MDRDFVVETPLMKLTKAQTWALAKTLGGEDLVDLIVVESHTCYQGDRGELHAWGHGCGECPACELRQRGYEDWDAAGRSLCLLPLREKVHEPSDEGPRPGPPSSAAHGPPLPDAFGPHPPARRGRP